MLIMLYSHDSYGLGHIRRTLEIASQLAEQLFARIGEHLAKHGLRVNQGTIAQRAQRKRELIRRSLSDHCLRTAIPA